MKKNIYILFLFVICCSFFLSGCTSKIASADFCETNAFRILRQVGNNEKIAVSYVFPVNSDKLLALGFDDADIKTYRFCLSTYVNALAASNKEKEVEGVTVSKSVYYTDVDGVGFSIVFDNYDVQKKFFGVEDDSGSSTTDSSGIFFKKITVKTNFPISSKESAENLKSICQMAISTWSSLSTRAKQKQQEIEAILDESLFVYDTASASSTLKSENMYEAQGLTHNVFVKSLNEIENSNEISFYISYPNVSVWYLTALLFACGGMAVAYIILKNKLIKKGKN